VTKVGRSPLVYRPARPTSLPACCTAMQRKAFLHCVVWTWQGSAKLHYIGLHEHCC